MFAIARAHPEYGIHRTTAELKDRGIRINHKVIEKLHQGWNLSILRSIRKPKPSPIRTIIREAGPYANLVAALDAIDDFEVLYTDFTEIIYQRGKSKAELMPIIDHRSKLAVGHALGESADTELALKAWRKAASVLRGYGRKPKDIVIHHDQDSVYTSHRWLYEVVIKHKGRVSYSENGAKGNVHMESFNGRFKSENRLLFWEQKDLSSLEKVVNNRIRYYNQIRRHSALGNKSPMQYLKEKGKIPR